jgi:flagellar biosynthesis/type III secretory pathway protein FliH
MQTNRAVTLDDLERAAWVNGNTLALDLLKAAEGKAEEDAEKAAEGAWSEGHSAGYTEGEDEGAERAQGVAGLVAARHGRALWQVAVTLSRADALLSDALGGNAESTLAAVREALLWVRRGAAITEAVEDELDGFDRTFGQAEREGKR